MRNKTRPADLGNKMKSSRESGFSTHAKWKRENKFQFFLGVVPLLQDPGGLRCQAVDAPVGVAVRVADGDGEAAKVGPDDLDGGFGVVGAPQVHGVPLAFVGRVISRAIGGMT